MRNIIFLLLLLLIIALAACAPRSIATQTATMVASSTKKPVLTTSPTLKPSATHTPFETAKPSVMISKVSPNGKYTAYAYFYWNEEQTIEIEDEKGNLIWQVPFQGGSPKGGYPRDTMDIYRWSDDSSKLYFCYSWGSDGGDPPIQVSCFGLQQLDIVTGEVHAVSISPDKSHVGYINCQDESCIIHVQNISTSSDKTASIVFESNEHLTPLWGIGWYDDPDFVFELQNEDHTVQMFYLDISTMKYKLIKKYPIRPLLGWAEFQWWVDSNTLEFLELGNEGVQVIHLNIRNGKTVVIGTPTPTPTRPSN